MADKTVERQRPAKQGVLGLASSILNGRHPAAQLIPLTLLIIDAVLCVLIIQKVPYTEIDWKAYMQQVTQVLSGERDYTQIQGDTGPLVYPAAHVWIYSVLYIFTDGGKNIAFAQWIFAILYIGTLVLVMSCYTAAKVPPYVFPMLILSKRLHSIFILRLFNDGFAVYWLWLAIYMFQQKQWSIGVVVFSLGLGVKMTVLLALPAVAVILFLGRGFDPAVRHLVRIAQVQVIIALPFLYKNIWGYFGRAFEFSRQFLFKWTVNWRFIGEDVFLSKPFAFTLLGFHAIVLWSFITKKYLRVTGMGTWRVIEPILAFNNPFGPRDQTNIARAVTPQYILTTILSAQLIGLLFARSLHYQFYAYLAWATPYLLWRSGIHPVLQYGLFFVQEWAWNVYPSTPLSSFVVVASIAATLMLVWRRDNEEYRPVKHDWAKK